MLWPNSLQYGVLGHFMRRVISAIKMVHSSFEERAMLALSVVTKLIQKINMYKKML